MKAKNREVIIVSGKSGSGKSSWVRWLLKDLLRVVVCDAGLGDYERQTTRFENFDQFADALGARNHGGAGTFRYRFEPQDPEEQEALFELALFFGKMHLILEEADRLESPDHSKPYKEAISRGRHQELSLVAVSTFPFNLPKALRAQVTKIIAFNHTEESDINWFSRIMGRDADILPELRREDSNGRLCSEFLEWNLGQPAEKKTLIINKESGTVDVKKCLTAPAPLK